MCKDNKIKTKSNTVNIYFEEHDTSIACFLFTLQKYYTFKTHWIATKQTNSMSNIKKSKWFTHNTRFLWFAIAILLSISFSVFLDVFAFEVDPYLVALLFLLLSLLCIHWHCTRVHVLLCAWIGVMAHIYPSTFMIHLILQ